MPTLRRTLHLLTHPVELMASIEAWIKHRKRIRELQAIRREWQKRHRKELEQFRDIHKGEKCFIIGNGPSLNQMNLCLLNDHICFGLNKIYLLFDRTGLEINYHVAVNALVIEQSASEFAKLDCPSFLSYKASLGKAPPCAGRYFLYSKGPFTFYPDITHGVFEGYTVTYVAMQLAYFMGFREVYLVGVDHNFIVSGKPGEKQYMDGPDPNHFDPNYFGGRDWQLPNLEGSELAYRMAQYFFRRDGREIYDATVGGKLDIFPKISYEEALKR